MLEIWRDIKGYEGFYQVSNLGRVRNSMTDKILKPVPNHRYLRVTLCKNGVHKLFRIHRLVAQAFIPNPDNLPTVNHKDQDKTNNCVDNLEWSDMEYQINYGDRNNRVSQKQINDPNKSKPVVQYTLDMVFVAEYPSAREASRQTGVDYGNIKHCCNGKFKTAGGYIWKYKIL